MTFFGRETSIGKLKIDTDGVSAGSPEMQKRLDRISTNYEKLNEILTELEVKIAQDERLKPKEIQPAESEVAAQQETGPAEVNDENLALPSAGPKKPR